MQQFRCVNLYIQASSFSVCSFSWPDLGIRSCHVILPSFFTIRFLHQMLLFLQETSIANTRDETFKIFSFIEHMKESEDCTTKCLKITYFKIIQILWWAKEWTTQRCPIAHSQLWAMMCLLWGEPWLCNTHTCDVVACLWKWNLSMLLIPGPTRLLKTGIKFGKHGMVWTR